jgi:glycosyltransferase involved in cell wall biosynthesis
MIPVLGRERYSEAGRIALVAPFEPDPGPEVAAMLSGLLDRGWDAHLVLEKEEPGRRPRPSTLSSVPRSRLHVSVQAPPRLGRRRDSMGVVHRLHPEIVHFLRADHARWLLVDSDAASTRSKLVATFTGPDASVAGLEEPDYYRPLWERADLLGFPDAAVLSRALRRGLPPELPRASVPPLIDPSAFESNGRVPAAGRPLRVLCAGRIEWSGGYEHGLQGLALASERGVACECRVVGDGPHLSALTFARHQLGLDERVSFDAAAPEALPAQLAWADVFLAPAVIDGLPEHLVEAAAMGLCLVLADPGPLEELELDRSAAITVPRRDPGAIAEALGEVAADPELRARMGAAAREWALERFPLGDHIDRLDEAYRRTLAG